MGPPLGQMRDQKVRVTLRLAVDRQSVRLGANPLEAHPYRRSRSYVNIDGQSWCDAPIWGPRPDFYYCQTVADLFILGALSDERTGLSFTIAAVFRQSSHIYRGQSQ
jgi:hypothetical protein